MVRIQITVDGLELEPGSMTADQRQDAMALLQYAMDQCLEADAEEQSQADSDLPGFIEFE